MPCPWLELGQRATIKSSDLKEKALSRIQEHGRHASLLDLGEVLWSNSQAQQRTPGSSTRAMRASFLPTRSSNSSCIACIFRFVSSSLTTSASLFQVIVSGHCWSRSSALSCIILNRSATALGCSRAHAHGPSSVRTSSPPPSVCLGPSRHSHHLPLPFQFDALFPFFFRCVHWTQTKRVSFSHSAMLCGLSASQYFP